LITQANALDFTFSFDVVNGYNNAFQQDAAFDGTISGAFLGLQDDSSSAVPTEVIIDSAPLAFGSCEGTRYRIKASGTPAKPTPCATPAIAPAVTRRLSCGCTIGGIPGLSPARDEIKEQHDDGDNQEQVNQAAADMADETK